MFQMFLHDVVVTTMEQKWLCILLTEDMKIPSLTLLLLYTNIHFYLETHPYVL